MQGVTRTQIIDSVRYEQAIAEIDKKNQAPAPAPVSDPLTVAREALSLLRDSTFTTNPAVTLFLIGEAEAALDQALAARAS